MKHRICKLGVFVLLGAIVNVAVAWGCAIHFRYGTTRSEHLGLDETSQVWRRLAKAGWIADPNGGYRQLGFGAYQIGAEAGLVAHVLPGGRVLSIARYVVDEASFGWPALTLMYRWQVESEVSVSGGGYSDALRISHAEIGIKRAPLPLGPIWTGFAINTIFYAAILWLLFAFPFALRRRRRIKRGLCPACGYDLRGAAHERCPECAEQVTPR